MTVTQGRHALAAGGIKVAAAQLVIDINTLAAHKGCGAFGINA